MGNVYKIIFNTGENLYSQNAPLIIKAGALVQNTENGNLHIQLKFQNLSDKIISTLKVKITLMGLFDRVLGEVEHQYLDLQCAEDMVCGSAVPVKIQEVAARKFSVRVIEIGYSDGTLWSGADSEWTPIPKQALGVSRFSASETPKKFQIGFSAEQIILYGILFFMVIVQYSSCIISSSYFNGYIFNRIISYYDSNNILLLWVKIIFPISATALLVIDFLRKDLKYQKLIRLIIVISSGIFTFWAIINACILCVDYYESAFSIVYDLFTEVIIPLLINIALSIAYSYLSKSSINKSR